MRSDSLAWYKLAESDNKVTLARRDKMKKFYESNEEFILIVLIATVIATMMGSWMGYVTWRQHMDGIRYDNARLNR